MKRRWVEFVVQARVENWVHIAGQTLKRHQRFEARQNVLKSFGPALVRLDVPLTSNQFGFHDGIDREPYR